MITANREPNRVAASDLHRVIEPLASYICASEQPKAVLSWAYSVLFNEVSQVNRAAKAHVAGFGRAYGKKTT